MKLSATRRSEADIGFRGAGGERIRTHDQRKFNVRMTDGHVTRSTWQVADVKRLLMAVTKMAENRVHLDSKDPRIVRPRVMSFHCGMLETCSSGQSLGQKRRNQQEDAGFSPAGLSPRVCVTDEGQSIRPVRSEGLARECKVVEFDLGGVEDAQEECKVGGPHAEEEPDMDCESGWRRGRSTCQAAAEASHTLESRVGAPCGVPHAVQGLVQTCVAGWGLERRHQKHPGHDDQYPLVCIDFGYLSGGATPMLVAKDRRTGMVFALPVERKGAADPHAVEKLAEWVDVLGSTQVTIRSDGEPAVMQVAAAVRDARRAGSVTTLETSAPGDHAGNGLAERAVGLVGGMVRTHKNELEFNCQMQIPPESKTIAWIIGHATTLLNLDTVGSDGKVPFERWQGRGHHMGRCVFRRTSVVSSGSVDRSIRRPKTGWNLAYSSVSG